MDDANKTRKRRKGGGPGGDAGRRPLESFAKLYERPLPFSLEAEMALLGAMILDPRAATDVMGVVSGSEDFYSEAHGAIYKALVDVYDAQPDADLVAIVDVLRDRGQLDDVGGPEFLARLGSETPSAAGAMRYAKTVADKAKLRRLIDAADQIIYDALNVGEYGLDGAREVIDAAESMVFEIAQEDQKADPQSLADLLQIELDRIEATDGKGISGLPTGFLDLDKLLSGLQPGEMTILAARPSMGKTAFALNLAEQIARGGRTPDDPPRGPHVGVGVFSLEMSKSSLVMRLLSAFSQVDSHRMRTGHLNKTELSMLRTAAEDGLSDVPLYIDDTPGLTILALRARARRMVAQHQVKCFIIDYLQLLSAPGSGRESRQVEVSAISRGIKALARELSVPIVCLSQLNRASEQREGNRPRMSDLRESGSIEQDADVVILLHREDYYHVQDPGWAEENPDKVNTAELIIAKQRNGPTGVVTLTWDNKTTRFRNHAGSFAGGGGWEGPVSSGGGAGGGFGGGGGGGGGFGGAGFGNSGKGGFAGDNPFAAPAFGAEPKPAFPAPAPQQRSAFGYRPPAGPIQNHRDGGGPDKDGDEGELPPF
jgi:replicative DNA helicase